MFKAKNLCSQRNNTDYPFIFNRFLLRLRSHLRLLLCWLVSLRMVIEKYAVEGEGKAFQRPLPLRFPELALPYRDTVPAHTCQLLLLFPVTLFVAAYLFPPKFRICLWQLKVFASVVAVPKTTVDKDARAVFPQHQVGMPGEARVVETVAEATCPQPVPHNHFLGVCPCCGLPTCSCGAGMVGLDYITDYCLSIRYNFVLN